MADQFVIVKNVSPGRASVPEQVDPVGARGHLGRRERNGIPSRNVSKRDVLRRNFEEQSVGRIVDFAADLSLGRQQIYTVLGSPKGSVTSGSPAHVDRTASEARCSAAPLSSAIHDKRMYRERTSDGDHTAYEPCDI